LRRQSLNLDLIFLDADKSNYAFYYRALRAQIMEGAVLLADNAGNYAELMPDFLDAIAADIKSGLIEAKRVELDHGLLIVRRRMCNLGLATTPVWSANRFYRPISADATCTANKLEL
jgi:hypothetical protein